MTAFPQALDNSSTSTATCNNGAEAISNTKSVSKPRKSSEIDDFKHDYVQAAVEEAMDEFCSDMRKQLWHWHYDMIKAFQLQVNLCQKHLFSHQLTHNMTIYCSLIYQFNTWKLQAQNMGENMFCTQIVFCFCFDIQNNLCTQHVLPMFWACSFMYW